MLLSWINCQYVGKNPLLKMHAMRLFCNHNRPKCTKYVSLGKRHRFITQLYTFNGQLTKDQIQRRFSCIYVRQALGCVRACVCVCVGVGMGVEWCKNQSLRCSTSSDGPDEHYYPCMSVGLFIQYCLFTICSYLMSMGPAKNMTVMVIFR